MAGPKLRRAQRIPVDLSVQVIGGRGRVTYHTVDVSRVGLFIHTSSPRPERQLVQLRIDLGSGEPLDTHGMVVRSIGPEQAEAEGTAAGMGIEFYGWSGEPQRRWEAYLTALAAAWGRSRAERRPATWPPRYRPGAAPPTLAEEVVVPLPVGDVESLYELCESDIPRGTTFVPAPVQLPVGCNVCLRVVHPVTHQAYDLHGKVMLLHGEPQFPGIPVALRPGLQTRRDEFRRFIEKALPPLSSRSS